MYKDKIVFVSNGELYSYFQDMCKKYKEMYNTTNFYIRNTMTGLKKLPVDRQPNEVEVLDTVFTQIKAINELRTSEYQKPDNKKPLKLIEFPDSDKWFLNYNTLDGIFKLAKNENYINLPAQINQNAIKECCQKWSDYFKALKDYKNHPSKYTGMPKIPQYIKQEQKTTVMTNIVCKLQSNENKKTYLRFPKTKSRLCLGQYIPSDAHLKEVKIKPFHNTYEVHIILEFPDSTTDKKEISRAISIDPGVDNFASISNNVGLPPILIKGTVMKARNQWFNKKVAEYSSIIMTQTGNSNYSLSKRLHTLYFNRYKYFKDYFHKISNSIINYCISNNIDTIVIGKNNLWKQNMNIGKKNNQHFSYLPYEIFNNQLKYKAEWNGINLIFNEESYTSKASFLDNDDIPTYKDGKDNYSFSGKRICRGLYQSKNGSILNADINGASNILKKAIPSAFDNVTTFNYLFSPIVWNSKKWYKCKSV